MCAVAATRPSATGTMSAVVLPTSTSSASGSASATASAVATQLAAATSHGRARAAATDTSSPAVVSTLNGPSPRASCAASSTNATPSRLVRNASDSSAVIVIAMASAGPAATSAATSRRTAASASRSRQTSNGRETVRSDSPSSHAALVFAPPMSTASVAAAVAGMRVVGVIDLKGGTAVHAVRGERERYRPVRSTIGGDDGDALSLARGFREQLGLDELYVADLDAIVGAGENGATIAALARETRVMVDAGVSDPGRAQALLDLGAHRVIVGTETLTGPDALDRLLAELPAGALVLSVDLREGRVLSPDAHLSGLPALDAVARLQRAGLREAIVLDLARVGSGSGPDVALIGELRAAFPELELLAGGGVRDIEDLRALEAAGAGGALVATALHRGVIGARELAELR